MQMRTKLSLTLLAVVPAGILAACSSEPTGSTGQQISCDTDPSTGVILRCGSGAGSGSGSGSGSASCQDIDQDGDGEPHDQGDDHGVDGPTHDQNDDHGDDGADHDQDDDHGSHATGDRDGDGIPDDRDCDERPGEDGTRAGLPYDVRPQLGATTTPIVDAFAAMGAHPAAIVSIAMDGSTWRLAELQAGTSFVVSQDDCNHAGNRDTGRDRVVVTWKTADQASHTDHLDIRYCKN
jgi:hypothetical protein